MLDTTVVSKRTPDTEFIVNNPNPEEGVLVVLNKNLAIKQGVTVGNLLLLKHAHIYKFQLYKEMEEANTPVELQELAKKVIETEFYLQELWGFPKNAQFHRFWEMPQCDCPKSDNEDRYGTAYYIYSDTCPIHSYIK